jgi:cytidylate kinase
MTTAFIIAIDGPNASGKGTLARRLGEKLNFPVLDTGLLYRAVGWVVRQQGGDINDPNTALHAADQLHELIGLDFLDNKDLRSMESSEAASIVSAYPSVRQSLFDLQRNFALHPPKGAKGAILDGRDIGTVICPDAPLKLFVTAKAELRAERRARELYGDDWQSHFAEVLEQTRIRDKRDSERPVAPLKPAEDAILIDTSDLTPDQTLEKAINLVKTHGFNV